MKKFIIIFPLLLLLNCGWSNDRDNPNEPVGAWDSETGPRIISSAVDSLTFSWRHVEKATAYRIYYVNTWGPPVIETYINKTGGDSSSIEADVNDYNRIYRIKAEDPSGNVIDYRIIMGFYDQIIPGFFSGSVADDFNGITGPDANYYSVNMSNGQAAAADTSGNNINIDVSAAGPNLYFGYDPAGKQYVKISLKFFQHYQPGNNFGAGLIIYSYRNNLDHAVIGHSSINAVESSGVEYYRYDARDYEPEKVDSALNSSPVFDVWFTRSVIIDASSGDLTISENGISTVKTMPWKFPGKLVFSVIAWSSGSGDYLNIDDLFIESSNTPF